MRKLVILLIILLAVALGLTWFVIKRPALPAQPVGTPARQNGPAQDSAPGTVNNVLQTQQAKQVPPATKTGANTSSKDLSEIDLIVGTNATLLIESPDGRRTGKDPANNQIVQDIPHSAYFEDRIDNSVTGQPGTEVSHQIQISQPAEGAYRLILAGLQVGTYDLVVTSYSKDGGEQPKIEEKGTTSPGSRVTFQLQFTSAQGGASTLTKLP